MIFGLKRTNYLGYDLMSDKICIIQVQQHSKIEKDIYLNHVAHKAYMVWEDTGELVKFPIPLSEVRKRKYVDNSFYNLLFNDLANDYPEMVRFVFKSDTPSWGESWWVAGATGLIELYKENWDSSD